MGEQKARSSLIINLAAAFRPLGHPTVVQYRHVASFAALGLGTGDGSPQTDYRLSNNAFMYCHSHRHGGLISLGGI
jgi:hypothetical protein